MGLFAFVAVISFYFAEAIPIKGELAQVLKVVEIG